MGASSYFTPSRQFARLFGKVAGPFYLIVSTGTALVLTHLRQNPPNRVLQICDCGPVHRVEAMNGLSH